MRSATLYCAASAYIGNSSFPAIAVFAPTCCFWMLVLSHGLLSYACVTCIPLPDSSLLGAFCNSARVPCRDMATALRVAGKRGSEATSSKGEAAPSASGPGRPPGDSQAGGAPFFSLRIWSHMSDPRAPDQETHAPVSRRQRQTADWRFGVGAVQVRGRGARRKLARALTGRLLRAEAIRPLLRIHLTSFPVRPGVLFVRPARPLWGRTFALCFACAAASSCFPAHECVYVQRQCVLWAAC